MRVAKRVLQGIQMNPSGICGMHANIQHIATRASVRTAFITLYPFAVRAAARLQVQLSY